MNSLRILFFMFFSFLALVTPAQQWKPAGTRIRTIWSEKVDPANPLPEYPRPQLVREQWQNLNGLWDFAVVPKGHGVPAKYDGSILVPFAIESSLSGVQGKVGPENELWYHRSFTV